MVFAGNEVKRRKILSSSSWSSVNKFSLLTEERIKKELVDAFTEEGDLVFDPFIGNGETLYACHHLNRNGISVTEDHSRLKEIGERIKHLESQLQLGEFGAKQKSKQLLLPSKLKDFDYLWQQYKLPELELVMAFLPKLKDLQAMSEQLYPGQNLKVGEFLEKTFTTLQAKMKLGAYLIILLENEYQDSKYINNSGKLIGLLSKTFQFKGEKFLGVETKASVNLKNMLVTHKNILFFRNVEV